MDEFQTFPTLIYQEKNLSPAWTFTLGTTEVKREQRGILSLTKMVGLGIQFYDKHSLNSISTIANPWVMVEKHSGVKSVCKASSILPSNNGQLIAPKMKKGNVPWQLHKDQPTACDRDGVLGQRQTLITWRQKMKGYVQVYTGNGKGKTTACLGLCVRAAGAGLKVFIVQFLKQGDYAEIKALERFSDLITVEQYGLGRFVRGKPSPEDVEAGRKGYERVVEILTRGEHDLVVVEEGNVAVMCNLFSEEELLRLIDLKPDHVELVITGRGATPRLIQRADLVTEMQEIKHYYHNGVKARVGIEK